MGSELASKFPPLSLPMRLLLNTIIGIINTHLNISRSRWLTSTNQPSYVKKYPCAPALENRVFLPASFSTRDPSKRYPLLLDIHGGGFIIMHPADDDRHCTALAHRCDMIVVSLDYRKAPQFPFPSAYDDIVALCGAVINDPDLPVDGRNVFLGGMSAGGNLACAAAQSPSLRGKIKGLILLYPVLDFTLTVEERIEHAVQKRDFLIRVFPAMASAYIPPGTDLRDPRVSPTHFRRREDLPANVYVVGVERDILCYEDRCLAEKLAGEELRRPVEGLEESWIAGGVRWELVKEGQLHAFNQNSRSGEMEVTRLRITEEVDTRLAEWVLALVKT